MKKLFLIGLCFFVFCSNQKNPAKREPKPSVVVSQLKSNFYNFFVHNYVDMLVFTGPEGILLVDSGMEPVDLISKEF